MSKSKEMATGLLLMEANRMSTKENEFLCRNCDNFVADEPIKVVDKPALFYANDEIWHWETGFKCTWNGIVSATIEGLHEGKCRCKGD